MCQRYEENGTVCPPNLRGKVFTTTVVDNVDHNPSSTTATGSFHGTSISLIQHPSTTEEGHCMGQIILRESSSEKCINPLPASYTNVPSVVSKSGKPTVSPVFESMMLRNQRTGPLLMKSAKKFNGWRTLTTSTQLERPRRRLQV